MGFLNSVTINDTKKGKTKSVCASYDSRLEFTPSDLRKILIPC